MRRGLPITPIDVENELMRIVDELESETEAFEELAIDEAKKTAIYDSEWASEYLAAQGAIRQREAWADWKTETLNRQAKIAEALVRAKKEKLASLRAAIEALRTIAANVRIQTQ